MTVHRLHLTVERAIGFKLVARGYVYECRTLAELAAQLADAYADDTAARARACTSLTRDRELTGDEQRELVHLATGLIVGKEERRGY